MATKTRPRKHVRLVEVDPTDMGAMTGETLPVQAIAVNVGAGGKGIVFTMSQSARAAMTLPNFHKFAQTLGDLVHPHPATLVVLPDGHEIKAYEVHAE